MESNLEVYQSIRAFIINKDISVEKRKYLDGRLMLFNEHNFLKRFIRDLPNFSGIKLEKEEFVHYNGLQEYIVANTKVIALQYERLDYLFKIYLAIVAVILLFNLAHLWKKKNSCTTMGFKSTSRRTLRSSRPPLSSIWPICGKRRIRALRWVARAHRGEH